MRSSARHFVPWETVEVGDKIRAIYNAEDLVTECEGVVGKIAGNGKLRSFFTEKGSLIFIAEIGKRVMVKVVMVQKGPTYDDGTLF